MFEVYRTFWGELDVGILFYVKVPLIGLNDLICSHIFVHCCKNNIQDVKKDIRSN